MKAYFHLILHIAQGSIVTLLDLLELVVISQFEQGSLSAAHLLHLTHDILIDPVHYFLTEETKVSDFNMI